MASSANSPVLQRAAPVELGFDPGRLGRIREAIERDVKAGLIPGAVVGIARHGKIAYLEGYGLRDVTSRQPMWADAVFSIASMTKPMTSVAIMMLPEEGRLLLGDPVSKYLPQLANMKVAKSPIADTLETVPAEREITVQDLLRHTSGLTYGNRGTGAAHRAYPGHGSAAVTLGRDEFLDALGKVPLLYQPGTAWEYGFSTDMLGLIVEAISGQSLGDFLKARLWDPLGMVDTAFDAVRRDARPLCARAAEVPADGRAARSCIMPPAQTVEVGIGRRRRRLDGGRLSPLRRDAARRAATLGGTRILGRKTVELMRADHLGPEIENRLDHHGPGLQRLRLRPRLRRAQGRRASAANGSAGDYYWSGVYGTYFWIDPVEEMTVVAHGGRAGQMRLRYRQLLRGLVLQAIVD